MQQSLKTPSPVDGETLLESRAVVGSNGEYELYNDDVYALSIRKLYLIVRANLLIISIIIASALAIALVVTMLQTPRFTAETTLQINDQSAQILGKQDDISQDPAVSASDTERFLQTQVDILKSRALAERVVQKLRLVGNAKFYDAMGVPQPPGDLSRQRLENLTIGAIENARSVSLPRSTRLATISFTSTQPEMAARIANTMASEFIQSNLQRRYDSSAYARDFISGQLAETRAKLEQSERELNAYARVAGLIRDRDSNSNPDKRTTGGSVTTASLLEINSAANQAEAARITAQQRWDLVSRSNPLNSPDVLANPAIASLLSDRARMQSELEKQRADHLDDYPAVAQLRAQVEVIDRQLRAVADNVRASVKQQYEAAVETERSLKRQVMSLKGSSLEEQDRLVQYNLLAREADTNRTVYEGLLQRYKELNAAAGISASNISIIDPAVPPIRPSSPNLFRNLLVAIVIGLALAGGFMYLRHQFDDSIRVPEDVEAKLGLTLLGVIPLAQVLEVASELDDPKSPVSEGYNSLRSALLYSTAAGLPKTLLVTSSQPGEGKSTTSFAIATGLARLGKSVVLLDIDLRRPSLHRTLTGAGAMNSTGMSSLLTSQNTISEVLQQTDQQHLQVITSGPIPPSPTELLSSNRLRGVLDELEDLFDVIIIDSPPVLGLADAPLMSALVDGVVMIVQSDRSWRGSLKASLRRLRDMRSNVLGAVLTKFDPTNTSIRYSEYYGYSYYRYSSKTDV